jgi:hypothetical protein
MSKKLKKSVQEIEDMHEDIYDELKDSIRQKRFSNADILSFAIKASERKKNKNGDRKEKKQVPHE